MDMRKYLQTITPCLNTHDKEQEIPSLIPQGSHSRNLSI